MISNLIVIGISYLTFITNFTLLIKIIIINRYITIILIIFTGFY